MSSIMTGLVWELPITQDFGRPEKYVLLAYADHADQNGKNIYPSIELISKKTGYEERSVQLITRNLESAGYLAGDGVGPHGTNKWYIPLQRASGGAKITPLQKNAPEGIAPEGIAPELGVEFKSTTGTTDATVQKNIFQIYTENLGVITPMIADMLKEIEQDTPEGWFEAATAEAVSQNKRNLKYIQAILARWKRDGYKSDLRGKGAHHENKFRNRDKVILPNVEQPEPSPEDRAAAERVKARKQQHRQVVP